MSLKELKNPVYVSGFIRNIEGWDELKGELIRASRMRPIQLRISSTLVNEIFCDTYTDQSPFVPIKTVYQNFVDACSSYGGRVIAEIEVDLYRIIFDD